jgi:pilus assembly protein CpaF
MELGKEYFGALWKYVDNREITDIDYNGSEIWVRNVYNERYRLNQEFVRECMTPSFVEQFTQRIANVVSRQFNKRNPQLEAETDELRVTILHESVAHSGRCISIRKTPPIIRLTAEKALSEGFCSKEILALLINCVKSHMNLVFCGMPGIGKTECIKFFSQFIPANERVITIEDTLEIRYGKTNPGKDCIEMKVSENTFDYAQAIKSSLRLNPIWLMLSEARSKEVKFLLECWSTGVRGMTTIHTDDVRNVPDRILNMLESRMDADRTENDVFQALDVAVLVRKRKGPDQVYYRYIDQMCFFLREKGENKTLMMVFDGNMVQRTLPEMITRQFLRAGVEDPYFCRELEERLNNRERG